jgi:hypothetical protein
MLPFAMNKSITRDFLNGGRASSGKFRGSCLVRVEVASRQLQGSEVPVLTACPSLFVLD